MIERSCGNPALDVVTAFALRSQRRLMPVGVARDTLATKSEKGLFGGGFGDRLPFTPKARHAMTLLACNILVLPAKRESRLRMVERRRIELGDRCRTADMFLVALIAGAPRETKVHPVLGGDDRLYVFVAIQAFPNPNLRSAVMTRRAVVHALQCFMGGGKFARGDLRRERHNRQCGPEQKPVYALGQKTHVYPSQRATPT
jgi:hypothetical protein